MLASDPKRNVQSAFRTVKELDDYGYEKNEDNAFEIASIGNALMELGTDHKLVEDEGGTFRMYRTHDHPHVAKGVLCNGLGLAQIHSSMS
jgi:hypothetical protein